MKKLPGLIICEGMDNTGKSTLARMISDDFGVIQTHSQGRPESIGAMFDRMDQLFNSGPGIQVRDRLHCISDYVYGPILRNEYPYLEDPRGRAQIARLRDDIPHLIIYCRPSSSTILGFKDGRDQLEGVIANGRRLLHAYDDLFIRMVADKRWTVALYNYENPTSYTELKGLIMEFMTRYQKYLEE